MRKIFFLILTFIATFTSAVYANSFLENDLLVQLHSLQDTCILSVKEGKYYLNSEKMHIQENKIFLNSDTYGPLVINCLKQDDEGIYTDLYSYYSCSNCGRTYTYQPAECKCGNTTFNLIDQTPGAD